MVDIPDSVIQAFVKLGEAQRGKPELAMLNVQKASGGGSINGLVEHVGDLTHRMTHLLRHYRNSNRASLLFGYEMVYEKVHRTYRIISTPYGFDREFKETCAANAKYFNMELTTYMDNLNKWLEKYTLSHAALVVYNECQWLARQAAMEVGNKEWSNAEYCLNKLRHMLNDPKAYNEFASEYRLNANGNPIPYQRAFR